MDALPRNRSTACFRSSRTRDHHGAARQLLLDRIPRDGKRSRGHRSMRCSGVSAATPTLARRLGAFDAMMIVMGGIIGSGIFINPYVVARAVHTPALIIGAWVAGGVIALLGAFAYAELAALRPEVGGQYAYLRDAYHPSVAFLYGWALLLIVQSGGMAAVAATFAKYVVTLTGIVMPDWLLAVATLLILTIINCLGVRSGSNTQTILMLLKLAAIGMLIAFGATTTVNRQPSTVNEPFDLLSFGAATAPVMFAYG